MLKIIIKIFCSFYDNKKITTKEFVILLVNIQYNTKLLSSK